MCGLFGYQIPESNPLVAPELAVLGFLLGAGAETRGRHACGMAGYQADGTVLLRKEDERFTGSGLLKDFDKTRNMIGHTRYATVGAHTAPNAHPFEYKHIIGAHNGGIYNHRELTEKYDNRSHFEVDSQHLIAHIADLCAYEELSGYGAVTWFNLYDPGTVYLCRMDGGDLEMEELKEGGFVWASTTEILSKSMGAIGQYSISSKKFLQQGVVYTIKDGMLTKTDDTIKFGSRAQSPYGISYATWEDAMASENGYSVPAPRPKHKVTVIGKPKAPEVAPTGASKSTNDSTKGTATYKAALSHYERSVDSGQGGWIPLRKLVTITPSKVLPLDTCIGLLFWLTDDDFEMVQIACDTLTRRMRRKYQSIANNILKHPIICACGGCARVKLLATEMLVPSDDINDPAEGCS